MKRSRKKIKGWSNNTILPIMKDRVNIKDKGSKGINKKVKIKDNMRKRAKKTNK